MNVRQVSDVLSSAKFVVGNSTHVHINSTSLSVFVDGFDAPDNANWLQESPFDIASLGDEEKAMFCVVFNAISFSYWGDPYWNVTYKGRLHTRGSWSLIACIFRSIEENNSLLEAVMLANADEATVRSCLRGNTEIPLLSERQAILNRVGNVITDSFEGSILNVLERFSGGAVELQQYVVDAFAPAFDDSYEYKGREVVFNKRAQALVESLHSVFRGTGYGNIREIESLTALADYIIPNLLRSLGILEYSNELCALIDSESLLERGSEAEIEIRAATVWAVELIRMELARRGVRCSAKSINDYLWVSGRDVKTPFHRTRTTAY